MHTVFFSMAAAALIISAAPAQAQDASGTWTGAIAGSLTVHMAFAKTPQGGWEGTMSVPQQGHKSTVERLVVSPGQLSFELSALKAAYAARWNPDEQAWAGTWTQQGQSIPLVLKRADAKSLVPKRPQEEAIAAAAPAYDSREVSFANDKAGVTLAGTFTVPRGKGPFPAVVLVQGSGPLDRNSRLFGHEPMLVLADHLTRHGIATVRYDKRGIGKSSGSFSGATTLDLAADAEAALRFLRSRTEIDARHIGMLGHSEGGLIAPMVAARDPALGFVVMLAAPGVTGAQLLPEQLALIAAADGMPAAQVAQERGMHQAMLTALASEADLALATSRAQEVVATALREGRYPATMDQGRLARFAGPWMHGLLRYDPVPALRALRQPVLALNGSLDLQVPAATVLPPIRAALQANPAAVVRELPGLNHVFQRAVTGAGSEYHAIEETMAPVALATIGDWIAATVKRPVVK